MLKIVVICYICCTLFHTVVGDSMIGPGKWMMLKIDKKEGTLDKFVFDIVQRKYNRSHDVFQGNFDFYEPLTDAYGAKVDVCKFVDGGCKQYQVISDDSFGSLVSKYAESNFKEMLGLAGAEDDGFPVRKGTYKIERYFWNWDCMPEDGPWGHYIAHCCVMEATVEVGCLDVELKFEKQDDDEDEYE